MSVTDDVGALLGGPLAAEAYDEAVSQLEHALQCAQLARAADAGEELLAAALLHDVGHLLVGHDPRWSSDLRHEVVGARWLRERFGPAVSGPVALHVEAKRYLCTTEPDYLDQLSEASKRSLEVQGGAMTDGEAAAFEQRPGWADAVRLRRWDDEAKVPGAVTPSLDDLLPVVERVSRSRRAPTSLPETSLPGAHRHTVGEQ